MDDAARGDTVYRARKRRSNMDKSKELTDSTEHAEKARPVRVSLNKKRKMITRRPHDDWVFRKNQ